MPLPGSDYDDFCCSWVHIRSVYGTFFDPGGQLYDPVTTPCLLHRLGVYLQWALWWPVSSAAALVDHRPYVHVNTCRTCDVAAAISCSAAAAIRCSDAALSCSAPTVGSAVSGNDAAISAESQCCRLEQRPCGSHGVLSLGARQ